MNFLSSLSFTTPLALAALLLLPVIWWLLRFTPPRPETVRFPPIRLLLELANREEQVFLTLTVAGQGCAVPVLLVRDVLSPQAITRIPLAPTEIAGSLNLRGRIVTAVDLRQRLGLPPRGPGAAPMSVAGSTPCWSTRWAKCCRCRRRASSPTRRRSTRCGARSRAVSTGRKTGC